MSKPTLDGNNSREIASNEAALIRQIQDYLISALQHSKKGNKEAVETFLADAMESTSELYELVDLVRQGRANDALTLITRKQLKGGKR